MGLENRIVGSFVLFLVGGILLGVHFESSSPAYAAVGVWTGFWLLWALPREWMSQSRNRKETPK